MTTLRPLKIVFLSVCLVGFPVMGFWIGGRFVEARNSPQAFLSQSRFAQLEAMLLMYHEDHKMFPPTKYQPHADGPAHSWRVLLVPYTSRDFHEAYSNYDFSQEWNSSNNLHALGRLPILNFRTNGSGDIANYLAIGIHDEWPTNRPLRARLITKGRDRFLLVEYPESDTHWMEPNY